MDYNILNSRLLKSHDNEIFRLTGCLPKCDYYVYSSMPVGTLTSYPVFDATLNNTVVMELYFPTGSHQVLEQVEIKL